MRKVKLPVGYLVGEARYREAILRPMTGKALLSARAKIGENPDPALFLDILRECVEGFEGYSGPVRVENLFWVDADYIFRELAIWEAEESGEPLVVRRACTKCGQNVEFTLNPEEQEVVYVEDTEFGKYPDLKIPFKLRVPVTTLDPQRTPYDTGKIGLLTVEDEIGRMKRFGGQTGKFWVEGIRLMIAELGPKKKGEIALADVEQMAASDLRRLEALYNKNEPGLKPFPPQVCPSCLAKSDIVPPPVWAVDFLLLPSGRG
jgi:hypothetical protein